MGGRRLRTEFDGAVDAEQHVVAFDVAVDDRVLVQELERLQTLHAAGNAKYCVLCCTRQRISYESSRAAPRRVNGAEFR